MTSSSALKRKPFYLQKKQPFFDRLKKMRLTECKRTNNSTEWFTYYIQYSIYPCGCDVDVIILG